MNLNRISIVGAPGTGKTTLANELSKIYNIPATHIERTRAEKADLIIWLDYYSYAQLKGVVKRRIKSGGKEKPEIPGCKEQLTLKFLKYVSKYNKEKRQIIVDNLEGIDKSKILIFKKQKDLNKWLKKQKESNANGKTNSTIC